MIIFSYFFHKWRSNIDYIYISQPMTWQDWNNILKTVYCIEFTESIICIMLITRTVSNCILYRIGRENFDQVWEVHRTELASV